MNNFAVKNSMKKFILSILSVILILTLTAVGQNVQFSASAKNVVRTGERFNLIYTLNADGSNFRGPDIEKFNVLTGPHTSQSSSVQIINGKVSRSVENTYTYVLSAGGEDGIFEIPPAKINVDGKIYESNSLKIQIVKSNASQQGTNSKPGTNSSNEYDFNNDVFIRAVVNKSRPKQGEQIIITYKLYYRINISQPQFTKEPGFKGFWKKDLLRDIQNYVQYKEKYKGQEYHVAELKKFALFPQRSGKIVIEPADVLCQVQVRTKTQQRSRDPFFDNFFNDPFFNRYKTVEVPIKTNTVTINVSPLPSKNQPAEFSGAVGNFDFKSSIDKTELKANEALNLKFTVSGTGNIELIDKIDVVFPPDFEVYDPKISKKVNTSANGVSGRKTFEYLIIPRTPGEFTINPVKFSYYDLKKNRYVSLTSPEYKINVAKGDGSAANINYSGVNQADIKYIGTDIRHIKTGAPQLTKIGTFFFGSTVFYLLILAPIVIFILFTIIWKKELQKRSNIALMRNRKATKVAQKRMKQAGVFLKENNKEKFYVEVSQALWGYLSDKFSIPLATLSMETVSETLAGKDVKEETIKQFIDTLNNCEFARFAPGDSTSTMENIYNEAVSIVSKIESELK